MKVKQPCPTFPGAEDREDVLAFRHRSNVCLSHVSYRYGAEARSHHYLLFMLEIIITISIVVRAVRVCAAREQTGQRAGGECRTKPPARFRNSALVLVLLPAVCYHPPAIVHSNHNNNNNTNEMTMKLMMFVTMTSSSSASSNPAAGYIGNPEQQARELRWEWEQASKQNGARDGATQCCMSNTHRHTDTHTHMLQNWQRSALNMVHHIIIETFLSSQTQPSANRKYRVGCFEGVICAINVRVVRLCLSTVNYSQLPGGFSSVNCMRNNWALTASGGNSWFMYYSNDDFNRGFIRFWRNLIELKFNSFQLLKRANHFFSPKQ